MANHPILSLSVVALAAAAACSQAHAQDATALPTVTVNARADNAAGVAGWGDIPASKTPFQTTTLTAGELRDRGVQRLSDLARIDPSVSDAYNAEGYWDQLTVRGFVIDNRFNYRRDGLPINAETSIPLDNKQAVEVLKGTSGLQAGVSAPGGLVNLVVKRPTDAPIRDVQLAWRQPGSVLGSADLSQRFGIDKAFGLRMNVAYEHLDPMVRSSRGERHLAALAGDWRISRDTLLEAEIESSRRSQPSQQAFSTLGGVVPPVTDPRISLNNQPWSLPVVMVGNTASLRLKHKLSADWSFTAHGMTQQLKSDDRLAFAFGCGKENNYSSYCSDGTYDVYDFRSDGEHRRTNALNLGVDGKFSTGPLRHTVSTGVLFTRFKARFNNQADGSTVVGEGNVLGTAVIPTSALAGLGTDVNTNRTERSTELYLRDAIALTPDWTAWLGVRHSQLHRRSIDTAGQNPTDASQSINTPSAALTWSLATGATAYASWGQGVESEVTRNRPMYTNSGRALPALKSRQTEVGLKWAGDRVVANVDLFEIVRPAFADLGACDGTAGSCTHALDGSARHRGIEASAGWRGGAWSFDGGVQALRARRENSVDATVNGQRPTNVPALALKLQGLYRVAAVPGLQLQANLLAESNRQVLPDNSVHIPGYARLDASARYQQRIAETTTTWRVGVDNLANRRAWRESPFQYGHAYLYPMAPRTFRASVEVSL